MNADEFLEITEVAARFHVRERVIQHYVDIGAIPYRKIGKTLKFRWADVLAWFDALPGADPLKTFSSQFPAPSAEMSGTEASPDDTTQPAKSISRGPRGRLRLTSNDSRGK